MCTSYNDLSRLHHFTTGCIEVVMYGSGNYNRSVQSRRDPLGAMKLEPEGSLRPPLRFRIQPCFPKTYMSASIHCVEYLEIAILHSSAHGKLVQRAIYPVGAIPKQGISKKVEGRQRAIPANMSLEGPVRRILNLGSVTATCSLILERVFLGFFSLKGVNSPMLNPLRHLQQNRFKHT